jgi:hypothetical protein
MRGVTEIRTYKRKPGSGAAFHHTVVVESDISVVVPADSLPAV